MSIATIQGPEKEVKFEAGQSKKQLFSVRNSSGRKMRFGFLVLSDDDTSKQWVHVDATETELDDNTLTEIKVMLNPPENAQPGRYSYRLSTYNADETSQSVDSEPVFFQVKPIEIKKCWWCKYAIAAAVLVLAVVLGVVFWPSGTTELPDFKEMGLASAVQFLDNNKLAYNTSVRLASSQELQDILDGKATVVLEQKPQPGEKVKKDEEVQLTVAGVKMPVVKEKPFNAAVKSILAAPGLDLKGAKWKRDARKQDIVVDSTPKSGAVVEFNTKVTLVVATKQNKVNWSDLNTAIMQLKKEQRLVVPVQPMRPAVPLQPK